MDAALTLSLAHATLLHVSPPELVVVAARTGYQAVGIRLVPIQQPGGPLQELAIDRATLRETRQAVAESGLSVVDVEVFQLRDDQDVQSYEPALEAAAELGARLLLVNLYTSNLSAGAERFAAFCDLAKPFGLAGALEFVSFSTLTTLAEASAIVEAVGSDSAVLIDTLHFHASGAAVDELETIAARMVRYVHVCDGPPDVSADPDDRRRVAREGRLFPGEGDIDVVGMLDALPRDIIYAVEVQNPTRAKELGAEMYARQARLATLRCLERIGDRRGLPGSRSAEH